MSYFIQNETTTKNHGSILYSGHNQNDLSDKINNTLVSLGYRLTKGSPMDGEYVKGKRFLRLLLGAFYSYSKISTHSSQTGDNVRLTVNKKSTGLSGGLLGIRQMKKEFKKVISFLEKV